MSDGSHYWIELLNAQESWMTDESILELVPEKDREFDSQKDWPRTKALAYLHNNVSALRLNHARLEAGEPLDLELLNAVLSTVALRIADWRGRADWKDRVRAAFDSGRRVLFLEPFDDGSRWNRGTFHLRVAMQRAVYFFSRYADQRLSDPRYPGASAGLFRVMTCAAPRCTKLVAMPSGVPAYCSLACTEDTGRIR